MEKLPPRQPLRAANSFSSKRLEGLSELCAVEEWQYWHVLCGLNKLWAFWAAILGGRPKSVSEEDMSARFFEFREAGLAGFVNHILFSLHQESFRRRDDSNFLRSRQAANNAAGPL